MQKLCFLRLVFLAFLRETVLNKLVKIVTVVEKVRRNLGFRDVFHVKESLANSFWLKVMVKMLVVASDRSFVALRYFFDGGWTLLMKELGWLELPLTFYLDVLELQPLILIFYKLVAVLQVDSLRDLLSFLKVCTDLFGIVFIVGKRLNDEHWLFSLFTFVLNHRKLYCRRIHQKVLTRDSRLRK